ncbi:MAG: hypothetical protein KKD29_03975 [Candidatus Omnitrophica bacterium]|nr:hypothetical protein [Candidatus Omnitrophota bacterium]MBU4488485.1 hypothetical protein [Candidatus Omnitrophota bacterium]MCG2704603.1 hypothetical protein [Candidatus Omnitrophota bacterium]
MLDKMISRLQKEGRIRKQKAGIVQIEALLKEAALDMKEAKKVSHLAERATYLLAYMAMLKAGRALLLLKGYVPDDGAQHKTVVDMTSAILGHKYKTISNHFEMMRRKRNEMTYEAGALLTRSEALKAFDDAVILIQKILEEAKLQNPQMEFKFDF